MIQSETSLSCLRPQSNGEKQVTECGKSKPRSFLAVIRPIKRGKWGDVIERHSVGGGRCWLKFQDASLERQHLNHIVNEKQEPAVQGG